MRLIFTTLIAIVGIATAPLAATFGPLVEANDLAGALDREQPILLRRHAGAGGSMRVHDAGQLLV